MSGRRKQVSNDMAQMDSRAGAADGLSEEQLHHFLSSSARTGQCQFQLATLGATCLLARPWRPGTENFGAARGQLREVGGTGHGASSKASQVSQSQAVLGSQVRASLNMTTLLIGVSFDSLTLAFASFRQISRRQPRRFYCFSGVSVRTRG